MLKGLTTQTSQICQTSVVPCSHYYTLDHASSACPYFAHQLSTG